MHPYRFPLVILLMLSAAVAGCGGDDTSSKAGATPSATAQRPTPRTDARLVSDTVREFRRRYEAKDPKACALVTSTFQPSAGGSPGDCKSLVRRHRFSYAIVSLSSQGNRVGERSATVLTTVRSDDGTGGRKPVDGRIGLRKEGSKWLISSIQTR
jgi:hypothetical protein